jgi:hypothetical protein
MKMLIAKVLYCHTELGSGSKMLKQVQHDRNEKGV